MYLKGVPKGWCLGKEILYVALICGVNLIFFFISENWYLNKNFKRKQCLHVLNVIFFSVPIKFLDWIFFVLSRKFQKWLFEHWHEMNVNLLWFLFFTQFHKKIKQWSHFGTVIYFCLNLFFCVFSICVLIGGGDGIFFFSFHCFSYLKAIWFLHDTYVHSL